MEIATLVEELSKTEITIVKVQSNYGYLPSADVVVERGRIAYGLAYPLDSDWLTAARDFHLEGGWGEGWSDEGMTITAGQRFRRAFPGNAANPTIWHVEC